jgi:dipeptidase D
MINLDSEQEGVFTAGCAGGAEVHVSIPASASKHAGIPVHVTVSGLLGGHSGEMIGRGRANADLVLGRVLYSLLEEMPFRRISMQGGSKDNAIPRSAEADILLPAGADPAAAQRILGEHAAKIAAEYSRTDGSLSVEIEVEVPVPAAENVSDGAAEETEQEIPAKAEDRPRGKYPAIGRRATKRILRYLVVTPDGVMEYDPSFPGLPQTSLNLGVLKVGADGMEAVYLLRSSVNSQREALQQKIRALAAAFDAEMTVTSAYPAWEFRTESPFRDRLLREYERQTGAAPSVKMTHGGLECGILSAKVEGLDCISLGPDMSGVHTPEERLSIPSTVRVWNFLKGALRTFAQTPSEAEND